MPEPAPSSLPDFEAMEANLHQTLASFTFAKPEGDRQVIPGAMLACAGVNFAMFNAAVLTAPVLGALELSERLSPAARYFTARRLPWSAWLCTSWMDEAIRSQMTLVLQKHRLHPIVESPGMLAENLAEPRHPLPALEYREVGDEATRRAFAYIMSACFGIGYALSMEIYGSERLWTGVYRGYLGYLNGIAVSATAAVAVAGVIGIYSVGTLPEYEGHGCAEALVREVLERQRRLHGPLPSMLQSTRDGFALYQRLGYRTICHYAIYASL